MAWPTQAPTVAEARPRTRTTSPAVAAPVWVQPCGVDRSSDVMIAGPPLPRRRAVPDPQLAAEDAAVRQPAALGVLDLVDDSGQRAGRLARPRQQGRQGGQQVGDAGTGQRRPGRDRHQHAPADLGAGGAHRQTGVDGRPAGRSRLGRTGELGQGRAQHPVVEHREDVDHPGVGQRDRARGGVHRARGDDVGQREGAHAAGRGQPPADLGQHSGRVGPAAVDLVNEDQGRHGQAAQGTPEDDGLRLDALHRRDDEDSRVEHGQASLDLGDEVGVARRVDEVDLDVPDGERRDVRAHGDAATPLDVHRVGAGGAVVDAAGRGDGAGLVQEPFGQARLARVNMREDAQIDGVRYVQQVTTAPEVGSGLSAEQ